MTGFDHEFAQRHQAALAGIADRVDLDYFGIDCAQTAEGSLLLFEADIAMIVHLIGFANSVSVQSHADAQALRRFHGDAERLRGPSVGTEALRRMSDPGRPKAGPTLDPENWSELRAHGHRMLDDMLDHLASAARAAGLAQLPDAVRARASAQRCRRGPTPLGDVHRAVHDATSRPMAAANAIRASWAGCRAAARASGMLAEMLAGGLNANLRRPRPHAASRSSARSSRWMRRAVRLSRRRQRHLRHRHLDGQFLRGAGRPRPRRWAPRCAAAALPRRAAAHAPMPRAAAHGCIARGDGHGGPRQRRAAPDRDRRRRIGSISTRWRAAIAPTARRGSSRSWSSARPARSTSAPSTISTRWPTSPRDEELWFHVDGALGALAMLSPELAPRLQGHRARRQSIALRFPQMGPGALRRRLPAGARRRAASRAPSRRTPPICARETRGLAGGSPWPCDFGPDLSRGFRALKTWFTLKTYGRDALGADDRAELRAGAPPRRRDRGRARSWSCWRRRAQHRLLPLSRRRSGPAQCRDRGGAA